MNKCSFTSAYYLLYGTYTHVLYLLTCVFVVCDAYCAGGCSTKGAGFCDSVCKTNYRLSSTFECERKSRVLYFYPKNVKLYIF